MRFVMGKWDAWEKANKSRPVIGFRCPDQAFKDRVHESADASGFESVQAYLLEAVRSYMEGDRPEWKPLPKAVQKSKPLKVDLPDKADLEEALKAFDDFEKGKG